MSDETPAPLPGLPSRPLTDRQRDVLEFVGEYIRANGRPPTIREIAEGLAYRSTSSVHAVFTVLVRKGHLVHTAVGQARGFRPRAATADPAREREALCVEAELWAGSLAAREGDDNEKLASLLRRVVECLRAESPAPLER